MKFQKIIIPSHEREDNIIKQIISSSRRRRQNPITFIFRKFRNAFCQSLARICPFNSIRVFLHRCRGVSIGKNVFIGLNCTLDNSYPEYISLEDGCGLTGEVYILTHSNPGKRFLGTFDSHVSPVIVKRDAWIGIRSTILPGVKIGEKSVVSAGTVVNKDVPDHTIVALPKNRTIKLVEE